MGIIGSTIGAIGSIAGQLISGSQQLKATREYNQAQYNLMNMQNQYNLEQWQRENQYNSPAAQIQRNREAGLNSLTGLANVPAGQVTSAGADIMPEDHTHLKDAFAGIGKALNESIQFKQAKLQNDMLDKQLEWYDVQQRLDKSIKESEDQIKKYEVRMKEIFHADPENVSEEVRKTPAFQSMHEELENLRQRNQNLRKEYDLQDQAYEFAKDMNPKTLRKMDKEFDVLSRQYKILGHEEKVKKIEGIIADRYGLTPGSDGLRALIQLGVMSPDGYHRVISHLLESIGNVGKGLFKSLFQ